MSAVNFSKIQHFILSYTWPSVLCRDLYQYILYRANPEGKVIVTLRPLAQDLRCTIQELKTALKHLIGQNLVTQSSTQLHTLLVIDLSMFFDTLKSESTHLPTHPKKDINSHQHTNQHTNNTTSNTVSNTQSTHHNIKEVVDLKRKNDNLEEGATHLIYKEQHSEQHTLNTPSNTLVDNSANVDGSLPPNGSPFSPFLPLNNPPLYPSFPSFNLPPSCADDFSSSQEEVFEWKAKNREQKRLQASSRGFPWDGYGRQVLENHNVLVLRNYDGTHLKPCRAVVKRLVEEKGMDAEAAIVLCAEVAKWRAWMAEDLPKTNVTPEKVYGDWSLFTRAMAEIEKMGGKFVKPQGGLFPKTPEFKRKVLWPCVSGRGEHGNESSWRGCGECNPVVSQAQPKTPLRELLKVMK